METQVEWLAQMLIDWSKSRWWHTGRYHRNLRRKRVHEFLVALRQIRTNNKEAS